MPPKMQQKSKTEKDKNLLPMKEKIMKIKRDVLQIVESMLEENISKNWFLENCSKLCKQDYADVIQERSIEHVCGYPLCDNPIVTIKKQYHISTITNKVYDITERKCFCCNECFKASNYIKSQLADLPLYMRKATEKEIKNFQLLSDSDNRGSVGDEVVFQHSLNKDEIQDPVPAESIDNNHLSNILHEEVKGCEQHLANLKITEKVYKKPFVFGSAKQKSSEDANGLLSGSSDEEEDNSDEDDNHILFPEYDNVSILSNKHMPIPEKTKKAVVISPIKPIKTPEIPSVKLTIEFVNEVFQDWFTEDTMKYLLGEKKVYSIKADKLLQTMVSSDDAPSSDKLSAIKKEYIELCLKIDSLKDEVLCDSDEEDILNVYSSKSKESNPEVLCIKRNPQSNPAKVLKPRPKSKSKDKKRIVTFKDQNDKEEEKLPKIYEDMIKESENQKHNTNCGGLSDSNSASSNHLSEPTFPLIDSVSQNALRKQILTSKLKTVYFDMLPLIGLRYRDIRDGVMQITETFSLSPTNVTYKPKEWKCIALVLFRILSRTTLQELQQDENFNFSKLCEPITKLINISIAEIENLVSDLISAEQVQRLQDCYQVQ